VAVYVMTRDAVKPFPPETFRLEFGGVKGNRVEALDVMSGQTIAVQVKTLSAEAVEVTLPVSDHPVIITLQK